MPMLPCSWLPLVAKLVPPVAALCTVKLPHDKNHWKKIEWCMKKIIGKNRMVHEKIEK
jgi:hypothetical protein